MTRLPILLHVVTDGEKCSPECPQTEPLKGHWCDTFGSIHGRVRHPACLAAEAAAREAEVKAMARGYDLHSEWDANAQQNFRAEVARIRGGDR